MNSPFLSRFRLAEYKFLDLTKIGVVADHFEWKASHLFHTTVEYLFLNESYLPFK